MTVYLVYLRSQEDNLLMAVFSSQEKAQARAERLTAIHKKRGLEGVVEEHSVIGALPPSAQATKAVCRWCGGSE